MGKALMYLAWVIMIIGVIVERFVYEFPNKIYLPFLGFCMLLGVIGYIIERRSR